MFAKNNLFLVICLTLMISCANEKNMQIGDIIDAAINNPSRSAENIEKDRFRKPADILNLRGSARNEYPGYGLKWWLLCRNACKYCRE